MAIHCRKEALALLAKAGSVKTQLPAIRCLIDTDKDVVSHWLKAKILQNSSFQEVNLILDTLGSNETIGGEILSTIFKQMANISNSDVIALVKTCGKNKIFDADIFKKLEDRVEIRSDKECITVVKAMNQLQVGFFSDKVMQWVQKSDIWELEYWFVLCEFFSREKKAEFFKPFSNIVSQHVILSGKQQHITVHEAMKIIYFFAKFGESSKEVKFLTLNVIAYQLRNVKDLLPLIRLFFSLSQLNEFDDFFIRRRLVPAIFYTYKTTPKTFKNIALVGSMLSELPFTNDMVEDFKKILICDFKALDADKEDKYFQFCRNWTSNNQHRSLD